MIDQKLQHETANASSIELPAELSHLEIRQSFQCQQLDSNVKLLEARDNLLQRDVLVKIVQHTQDQAEALVDEARRVAALKHFSFLKIHGLVQQEHQLCIVMESVKGQLLVDWIKERATKESTQERSEGSKERQIVRHLLDLAQAFEEARQLGLVHGNLGSDQLWVDQAGRIRILNFGLQAHRDQSDFGLAQPMQGGAQDLDRRIHYLAPERFSDTRPTSAGDVFALGVIAYEMLTGALPYAEIHGLALLAAQVQCRSEQWTWPETVSLALRNLILHMTQRELDARANYAAIVQACETIRADDSGSSSLSSSQLDALQAQFEATAKAKRRRQYAVFALLLALSGIGAWQAKPYWPQIVKALKPYSESREIELGLAALKQYDKPGMLDQAHQHFAAVLERNPDNALAVAYMSIEYSYRFRSGSRDDVWRERAIASAQQALRLNADLAMTQVAYALSLDPHNEFDIAMAAIQKAKGIEPDNLIVWQTEVRTLLLARKYVPTIEAADQALSRFKDDWLILNLKGVAYMNQGQQEPAAQQFRLAIEKHPDVILSYRFLSVALENQGRIEESLQVCQQGLQIRSDESLYARLGRLKFSQGDYAATAVAVEKAITLNPYEYESWILLADALKQFEGRKEESLAAYKKAQELLGVRLNRRPNDAWMTALMALLEAQLGDHQQAKRMSKRAVELGPDTAMVHFLIASVDELAGRRTDAIASLNEARRLGMAETEIFNEPNFKELRKDPRFHR